MSDPQPIRVELAPSRCPYCHDELTSVTELVACAACGARHHDGCFREHGACATCAGTVVLVPEPLSARPAPVSLDELPDDACLTVEREEGRVVLSWPLVPDREVRRTLIACAALVPVMWSGIVFFLWFLAMRRKRVTLELTREGLECWTSGALHSLTRARRRATRDEVSVIDHSQGRLLLRRLRGRSSVLALSGGFCNVLSVAEVEWLHGILRGWHAGSLQLAPRGAAAPKPDPKRQTPKPDPLKSRG